MTFIASATGTITTAVDTVSTSSTLNIAEGDMLVAIIGGNDNFASLTVSDGGSNSFTVPAATQGVWSGCRGAYVLSAAANSTATITATEDGMQNTTLIVLQFRPAAGETVTFADGLALASSSWSNAPSSGNVSAGAAASLIIGGSSNGHVRTYNSASIAETAADGYVSDTITAASYTIFDSLQTAVDADFSLSSSGTWTAIAMAFDITTSGGTTYSPTYYTTLLAGGN